MIREAPTAVPPHSLKRSHAAFCRQGVASAPNKQHSPLSLQAAQKRQREEALGSMSLQGASLPAARRHGGPAPQLPCLAGQVPGPAQPSCGCAWLPGSNLALRRRQRTLHCSNLALQQPCTAATLHCGADSAPCTAATLHCGADSASCTAATLHCGADSVPCTAAQTAHLALQRSQRCCRALHTPGQLLGQLCAVLRIRGAEGGHCQCQRLQEAVHMVHIKLVRMRTWTGGCFFCISCRECAPVFRLRVCMGMCVRACACVCMRVCVNVCACIFVCARACVRVCVCVCVCVCVRVCVCARGRALMRTQAGTPMA